MDRRTFLASSASTITVLADSNWARATPVNVDWSALRARIGNRLIEINSPLVEAARNGGAGANRLFAALKNPFYISDEPSLTQTLGWTDAWTSRPSLKGVAAESAADVAAAINFARAAGIPPVIKGGGHSYFGNSNRAGSLLIWTHRMRSVELHDAFIAEGAPAKTPAVEAVSVGAGCLWGEVYRKVCVEHGRYVQGGGCLTVETAGFVQGGGFGSLSKQFGTGAANLIEAEVVTADGRVRIANLWQEPDLFYALRGGGGGTFGVVTRMTLKTYPLPSFIGAAVMEIRAANDEAWRTLVDRMTGFYAEKLFNPSWGEQIRFRPGRVLEITMVCHGLTRDEIGRTWAPFTDWVKAHAGLSFARAPLFLAVPAGAFWNPKFLRGLPGLVLVDDRPGAPFENIYWTGNRGEAGQVLHAYQSAWLPSSLLESGARSRLVDALVRASNIWDVTLHTNKGLGGGSAEAVAATRETAMSPAVLGAFALLICAAEEQPAWPGIPGHEPNVAKGRYDAAGVRRAMQPIRELVPGAGSYLSESDYFEPNWKRAHWGGNYSRLASIKRRYDPHWLFKGHHCVEPN